MMAKQATAKACKKSQTLPGSRSTPAWPAIADLVTEPQERTLAVMLPDGRIVTEHGECMLSGEATWGEAAEALFAHNLLVFTGPLRHALRPWWDCVTAELELPHRQSDNTLCRSTSLHYAEQANGVVTLSVWMLWPGVDGKPHWQRRALTQASVWGGRAPSHELLSDLRALFTLCGVGVAGTPGGLGAKLMYREWKQEGNDKRITHRPTSACASDLVRHSVGSIKEAYYPDESFPGAWELDRRNGYAAECLAELPAGTAVGPLRRDEADALIHQRADVVLPPLVTWFGRCVVRIAEGVPTGDVPPFAIRGAGGAVVLPSQPGDYDAWLWKRDAEYIMERGAEESGRYRVMACEHAWVWVRGSTQLAGWARTMDGYREQAGALPGRVAELVKVAIVAAIGRLGMPYCEYRVTTEPTSVELDRMEGRTCVELADGMAAGVPLFVVREPRDSGAPKHWHSYILAGQNLWTLRLAHEAYRAGAAILALNTDAVYMREDCQLGVSSAEAKIGEAKRRKIVGYFACPAPAAILDPEKLATPGISAAERRYIMAGYWVRDAPSGKGSQRGRDEPRDRKHARESFGRMLKRGVQQAKTYTPEELERLRLFYRKQAAKAQEGGADWLPLVRGENRRAGRIHRLQ